MKWVSRPWPGRASALTAAVALLASLDATQAQTPLGILEASRSDRLEQVSLHCGSRDSHSADVVETTLSIADPGGASIAGENRNTDSRGTQTDPVHTDESQPSDLQTRTPQTLELVLHFPDKQRDIPTECIPRLLKISEQVKSGQKGKLTIRSRNSAEASSEMDLAVASERLDRIKNFFRNDRLALRAMKLELRPYDGYELPSATQGGTQVIEIYSSPVN